MREPWLGQFIRGVVISRVELPTLLKFFAPERQTSKQLKCSVAQLLICNFAAAPVTHAGGKLH